MRDEDDWRPAASFEVMRLRARMLSRIRAFFDVAGVWEVDTPTLSAAATTDPHIDSLSTMLSGPLASERYLHTSPELPMKRLLAAGSGAIYQIAKVFRDGEFGGHHNPEFSLLEWYRPGWDHLALMEEVEAVMRAALGDDASLPGAEYLSYRELFIDSVGVDPFTAEARELRQCALGLGIDPPNEMQSVDEWLDLILTHYIEARLPVFAFVYDYPPSQAALARIRRDELPVAERFEVYLHGVEIANGFHELVDPHEQSRRFHNDNQQRIAGNKRAMPLDERFLAGLSVGMPPSAGVAMGVDRLLMYAAGVESIAEVIAFPGDRA